VGVFYGANFLCHELAQLIQRVPLFSCEGKGKVRTIVSMTMVLFVQVQHASFLWPEYSSGDEFSMM